MSTATLDGMSFIWLGSIARCSTALPSALSSIDATLPTWTPRILTLASGSITRPARSETTVTGTVLVKLPRNRATARAAINTSAKTRPAPASGRAAPDFIVWCPLSRQVEVAVGAVDGQRHQKRHRHHHDQ